MVVTNTYPLMNRIKGTNFSGDTTITLSDTDVIKDGKGNILTFNDIKVDDIINVQETAAAHVLHLF